MSTNDAAGLQRSGTTDAEVSITSKPDGVPERATWVGRDAAGREHWHRGAIPRGTVIVTDADTVVERVNLPAREHSTGTDINVVPDWMAYVDARCGWSRRASDVDLVGELRAGVEGDE